MIKDDKTGVKSMYGSGEYNKKQRKKSKSEKRKNWWNTEKSKIQYK